MPAGTNVPANPHYWIQVKREDAYGHAVFDRLPQAWSMPEGEIRQSNDWKVREANRAAAQGAAQGAAKKERTLEQRRQDMRQQNDLVTPESNLSPPRQELSIPPWNKDPSIPEDTTQAPGQY